METIIYAVLALLVLLAVLDLFVGVSNDAVNFLNSAVGSRCAPFWVIMTVASIGVILGSTFSSGMMSIAKTGVFSPELFTFNEILVIYTAVMVCDVLLLNAFNSLGLPTSTTVSIVFELLGAACALSFWKIWSGNLPLSEISSFINSSRALAMIMAILSSVVVAFIAGLIVQYILRLIFSFHWERVYKYLGGIYGGVSLTAVIYFLLFKGAKGASFMRPEWVDWLQANTDPLLLALFVGFSLFFQILILTTRINVFRIIILVGTFALAFAFAGNDLVNFVGVPFAALDSFSIFSAAPGADPDTFTMEGLRTSTHTATLLLFASGAIMVLTLWFSKKARRVIQTSIRLSSAARGSKEQFGSTPPARITVRAALRFSDLVHQFIPQTVFDGLATRFEPKETDPSEPQLPFDEVRASVNLVLAAALIASATSLKLPLSTTYVTFMVAMGSSLADGAWDRESAVYRVSGVFTVISGWFVTAFTAFTVAAIFALIFNSLGYWVMLILALIAVGVVIKENFFAHDEKDSPEHLAVLTGDQKSIRDILDTAVSQYRNKCFDLFDHGLRAFLDRDAAQLKALKGDAAEMFDEISFKRGDYYTMAIESPGTKEDRDARNFYYRAFTNMKEITHQLRDVLGVAQNYVANSHSDFTGKMREGTLKMEGGMKYLRDNFSIANSKNTLDLIDSAQRDFVLEINTEQLSLRKSELYLNYLLFARDLINRFMVVLLLQEGLDRAIQRSSNAEQKNAVETFIKQEETEPVRRSER
jgi:phosphate/sulfate permease